MEIRNSVLCLLVTCCCCVVTAGRFDPSTVEPLGEPPTVVRNETEILKHYGYTSSIYRVETEDGYFVDLMRMGNNTGPPVLMLNGMGTSPGVWLVYGSHHGLAYVLHDMGYDVWFPGKRGITREHRTLKWSNPKYWEFSHDEHGQYDMPPQIDMVMNVTGYKKLLYVGASHGGSIFMSMCSLKPEYCDKFAANVQIVPAMYMPSEADLSRDAKKSWAMSKLALAFLKIARMPYVIVDAKAFLKLNLCLPFKYFCERGLKSFAAILPEHLYAQEWTNFIVPTIGDGLSHRQVDHYIQMTRGKGGTAMYDYGTKKNMEKYGQPTPPHHDLSKITPPTLIIYSQNDYFIPSAVMKKVAKLIGDNVIMYPVKDPSYGHISCVIGKDLYKIYFPRVVEYFDEISGYPWKEDL